MYVIQDMGNQYGWEKLSPTASTGFTTSVIKPTSGDYKGMQARAVLIGVETQPIRFKLSGDAATATNGLQIKADNTYLIVGRENVRNFRCIDTSAGASAVHVLPFF